MGTIGARFHAIPGTQAAEISTVLDAVRSGFEAGIQVDSIS